jgi:hypothetical protein
LAGKNSHYASAKIFPRGDQFPERWGHMFEVMRKISMTDFDANREHQQRNILGVPISG